MITSNKVGFIAFSIVLITMTSCSRIRSYLPDKERDYQFSTEIAPLTVPNDLKNNTLKRPVIVSDRPDETEEVVVMGEMVDADTVKSKSEPATTTDNEESSENIVIERGETRVDFVMFDGGATRLRINEDFVPSWRLVGKALSRNKIEITSRNKAAGEFIIQYDPNETPFKDDTVLDELSYIFGDDPSHEKEYHIKIVEYNNNAEVIVLNKEDIPLSDGVGLTLLKLLFSTIHTELTVKR